jgi:carbamoyl-phosphate synthase large subunit
VLERAGIPVTRVAKVSEAKESRRDRSIVDLIRAGEVDMVINTPFGRGARTDGYYIRTAAAQAGIACITTLQGALAALRGIESLRGAPGTPRSLQEYHEHAASPTPVQTRLGLSATRVG